MLAGGTRPKGVQYLSDVMVVSGVRLCVQGHSHRLLLFTPIRYLLKIQPNNNNKKALRSSIETLS